MFSCILLIHLYYDANFGLGQITDQHKHKTFITGKPPNLTNLCFQNTHKCEKNNTSLKYFTVTYCYINHGRKKTQHTKKTEN